MKNKGFTLVELLAVIVILGIIMIIAIPSVLQTMTAAQKSAFDEYVTKVYTTTEKEYVADGITSSHTECTLYDITKDIGLSSTGKYKGYVLVKKESINNTKYYITLWDGDYMIYGFDYEKDIDSIRHLAFTTDDDEVLSKENLAKVARCSSYSYGGESHVTPEGPGIPSDPPAKIVEDYVNPGTVDPLDEFCIKDECFYVLSNDGTKVTALAKYNLYVGYGPDPAGIERVVLLEETGIQSPKATAKNGYGLVSIVEWDSPNFYWRQGDGLLPQYGSDYPAYVFDENCKLYKYIDYYDKYLKGLGANIIDTRFIKLEELIELGCNSNTGDCRRAKATIYSTNYWSGTASFYGGMYTIWAGGAYYSTWATDLSLSGLRPVIEIYLTDIA